MCTKNECIAILQSHQHQIQKEFGVRALSIFASVARGANGANSDVDILVDMPPKIFVMEALRRYLESMLASSVDIIRRHSHLSPKFLNQISHDLITIF